MRLPHLILQAFIALGESLCPCPLPGYQDAAWAYEDVYFRAAFAEIVRREWGAGALPGIP